MDDALVFTSVFGSALVHNSVAGRRRRLTATTASGSRALEAASPLVLRLDVMVIFSTEHCTAAPRPAPLLWDEIDPRIPASPRAGLGPKTRSSESVLRPAPTTGRRQLWFGRQLPVATDEAEPRSVR